MQRDAKHCVPPDVLDSFIPYEAFNYQLNNYQLPTINYQLNHTLPISYKHLATASSMGTR